MAKSKRKSAFGKKVSKVVKTSEFKSSKPTNSSVMAHCMKCKTKTKITGAQKVKTKNGGNRLKGKCSTCGTNVSAFTK